MNSKNFIMQIVFNYVMSFIFIWFTINSVSTEGWGIFPVLFVLFATNDFVRASKLLEIYFKIKKGGKPK
ncbi:DUF4305 domain-containing protein [Carnobacterium mobile]|uniref:DUF4305 domain-containing protein n=1 Tax=Carnobacterium mobile TaxID=2750 RepID=UPI0005504E49|nr:DUF4305 domain-containing protein [Carnobacterium mobile]